MNAPRIMAALGAAVLLPLTVTVPAHADEHFSGTIDGSEPTKVFTEPNVIPSLCDPAGSPAGPLPFDAIDFVSQSNGPRRIVISGSAADAPPGVTPFAIYAYRNGACVAADYATDEDTPELAEVEAGILDLDDVVFAVGDQVRIEIIAFGLPATWNVSILQAGTANAPATGKATKYVSLPYQYGCVDRKALAEFTKKGRKKIESVVVKAGGKKVAETSKISKKPLKLKKIPAGTTSIKVVAKLENGKKAKATRAYSAC